MCVILTIDFVIDSFRRRAYSKKPRQIWPDPCTEGRKPQSQCIGSQDEGHEQLETKLQQSETRQNCKLITNTNC